MDVEALSGPFPSVRRSTAKSSLLKCTFQNHKDREALDMGCNHGGKEVFITGHSEKDSRLWIGAHVEEIRTNQPYRWLQDLDVLMHKF